MNTKLFSLSFRPATATNIRLRSFANLFSAAIFYRVFVTFANTLISDDRIFCAVACKETNPLTSAKTEHFLGGIVVSLNDNV